MFVLDIGDDAGALVVYAPPALKDEEVEISFDDGGPPHKVHTGVVERLVNGAPVCAAVFPSLRAGTYTLWRPNPVPQPGFAIRPGELTELDWRQAASG
ncbi:MAG TPA: hypothetical protein VK009_07140 [Chloroflexota bacterium]|nr:hypothetical protein [Chloroflexota bacterium]